MRVTTHLMRTRDHSLRFWVESEVGVEGRVGVRQTVLAQRIRPVKFPRVSLTPQSPPSLRAPPNTGCLPWYHVRHPSPFAVEPCIQWWLARIPNSLDTAEQLRVCIEAFCHSPRLGTGTEIPQDHNHGPV